MKKISLLAIVLLTAVQIFGQANKHGISSIKNYPFTITTGSEQNFSITQDKRGVMYIGNDDKGILEYDGSEWRNIPISDNRIIRSLATADDGTVYVGSIAEIGYLSPDKNGTLSFYSLLPELDSAFHEFTDVWKTYCADGKVYFYSEQFLMIYTPEANTFKIIDPPFNSLFCFYINGQLYNGDFLEGLMVLDGDTIVGVPGGDFYSKKNIFGLSAYDADNLIVGTPENGLTIYNIQTGTVDSTFSSPEVIQYIQNHFIFHLLTLPTNEFAVSTGDGGLAIVSRNGELKEVISVEEGLQDPTIFLTYLNPDAYPYSPVWSALSLGVSKTSLNSPLRSFTTESGFSGLVSDINTIGNKLFVGTATGLFSMTAIDGKSYFEPVEEIDFRVWDLLNYTLKSGEEVIFAMTAEGVYQISKNGKTIYLDSEVQERGDPEGSRYWGYTISQDQYNPERIVFGRESSINFLRYRNGVWYEESKIEEVKGPVRSMEFDQDGTLWFGAVLGGIGKINPDEESAAIVYYNEEKGLPSLGENSVSIIKNKLLFGTKDGVYIYDSQADLFVKDSIFNAYLPEGRNFVYTIKEDSEGCIWFSFENSELGWLVTYLKPSENGYTRVLMPFLGLPRSSSTDAFYCDKEGGIWFPKANVLYSYDKSLELSESSKTGKTYYRTLVRKVTVDSDSIIFNGAYPLGFEASGYKLGDAQNKELIPHIRHSDNNVEFRWSAPYFDQEEALEYSYFLEGFSSNWSSWEDLKYKDFTNLPHKTYTFRVKARNVYMDESAEDSFTFIILRPWYLTIVAFIIYLILAVFIVWVIIALYTRRLKNENIRLEGIIQERTAEIRKQKEELTDSIEYASRIQRALLPPDEILEKHALEHFILFRPRDIVSGDFYWIGTKNNKIFIVAADCTGHGVPGAFMSMLGISFLDEIIIKSGVCETNKILDTLKEHVITSLRQTGKSMDESTKDGMDLAMIAIDEKTKTVQYSGAYNPLYTVRKLNNKEKAILEKGEELELDRGDLHNDTHILFQSKADPMPIGISEKKFEFSATTIEDVKDSTLYLFSDGYVDQFGGPNGKKFMAKNFKKLLLEIQDLSMEKQRARLDQILVEWMGEISQIDDVLVIGVKLTK